MMDKSKRSQKILKKGVSKQLMSKPNQMEPSDEENGALLTSREDITEPGEEQLSEMSVISKDLRDFKKRHSRSYY